MKILPLALLAIVSTGTLPAQFFDGRNDAMGGVGVASSRYVNAAAFNPALITFAPEGTTFGFMLPSLGVRITDEDELRESIDDFQDTLRDVQTKLDNSTVTVNDINLLVSQFQGLDNRRAYINAGGGFAFTFPAEALSVSLYGHTYLDAQVFARIDPTDEARIRSATSSTDLDNLQSEGVVLGAAVTDIGLALAKKFTLGTVGLSIGATPKLQRVDTYNYSVNVANFDEGDYNDDRFRTDDTRFNLDLGVAVQPIPSVTIGLTARNLLEEDFDTVLNNGNRFTYQLDPSITLGAAVSLGSITLSADIDITEIERFKQSTSFSSVLDDNSRILRAGAEFGVIPGILYLRGGYRHDLEDTIDDLFSAGIGVSANLVNFDLAVMASSRDSYGASLSLSFNF